MRESTQKIEHHPERVREPAHEGENVRDEEKRLVQEAKNLLLNLKKCTQTDRAVCYRRLMEGWC